ncbi:hypothetical protein NR798_03410 [Archangium gephyra]|uniref:hypothetical protein n=1 Tax=Archangium gephyra TaxID=48 RepID=UPI0035D3F6F1
MTSPAVPSPAIYVDVDDTLVRSFGSKRIPMTGMVERVRELAQKGATLYLWSTAGADYARRTAAELGLEDCFQAFLPKPEVLIDDRALEDWRVSEIHPAACHSMRLEDILRTRRG